jgi:hypothetical protein
MDTLNPLLQTQSNDPSSIDTSLECEKSECGRQVPCTGESEFHL